MMPKTVNVSETGGVKLISECRAILPGRITGWIWLCVCLAFTALPRLAAADPGFVIMQISSAKGGVVGIPGGFTNDNYISISNFVFGVDRELSESVRDGTADVTIGVGELQMVKFSKGVDQSSAFLARKAIAGSSVGTVKIYFIKYRDAGSGSMVPYVHLAYILDNAFVKSWGVSANDPNAPAEEVELWYNKIAMNTLSIKADGTPGAVLKAEWDNVQNKPWSDAPTVIPADGALPPANP